MAENSFFSNTLSLLNSSPSHFSIFKLLSKISHNPTVGIKIFLHQITPHEILYKPIPNLLVEKFDSRISNLTEQLGQMGIFELMRILNFSSLLEVKSFNPMSFSLTITHQFIQSCRISYLGS